MYVFFIVICMCIVIYRKYSRSKTDFSMKVTNCYKLIRNNEISLKNSVDKVVFEDEKGQSITLKSGDYVKIEPNVKHWVNAKTDSNLLLIK